MVYRDYLPYASARQYQDRKMAKWMGFFLSEHHSRLNSEDVMSSESITTMPVEQLMARLNQACLNRLHLIFWLDLNGVAEPVHGNVLWLAESTVAIQTDDRVLTVRYTQILTVELGEEDEHVATSATTDADSI